MRKYKSFAWFLLMRNKIEFWLKKKKARDHDSLYFGILRP